jgi:hypothetical protein
VAGLARWAALFGLALWGGALRAGATIELDVPTLNVLLPALTPRAIDVPVAGRTLRVELADLQVTGFDPAAGQGSEGHILTRVRVRVPELGLEMPIAPRLALGVIERDAASLLELRFAQAQLALPLLGAVDLATLLPPLRFPADSVFAVGGASGEVDVRSRLAGVRMGKGSIEFEFDLGVIEPPPLPAAR